MEINEWTSLLGVNHLRNGLDYAKQTVALLDTGVDFNHPDLKGTISDAQNFFSPGQDCSDTDGHGTHSAGIIAATGQHDISGVVPGIPLVIAKVTAYRSFGLHAEVLVKALAWAMDQSDIIVMPGGLAVESNILAKQAAEIAGKGKILVMAIGNRTRDNHTAQFPALMEEVIAVGALNDDLELADFSVRNPAVDIHVPATNIISTGLARKGGLAKYSGTGIGASLVGGLAALYKTAHPSHGVQEFRRYLHGLCREKSTNGFVYKAIRKQQISTLQ